MIGMNDKNSDYVDYELDIDFDLNFPSSSVDYHDLYIKEVQKNNDLEDIIQSLTVELSLCKEKLLNYDKITNEEVLSNTLSVAITSSDAVDSGSNTNIIIPTSSFDRMKEEEKDRRQRLRQLRIKPQRKPNSNSISSISNDTGINELNITNALISNKDTNNASVESFKDITNDPKSYSNHREPVKSSINHEYDHGIINSSNLATNSSWQWHDETSDCSEEEEEDVEDTEQVIQAVDQSDKTIIIDPKIDVHTSYLGGDDNDTGINTALIDNVESESFVVGIDKTRTDTAILLSRKDQAAIERQRRVQNMRRNVKNTATRRLQNQPQMSRSISPIPNAPIASTSNSISNLIKSKDAIIPNHSNIATIQAVNKHRYEDNSSKSSSSDDNNKDNDDDWDSSDSEEELDLQSSTSDINNHTSTINESKPAFSTINDTSSGKTVTSTGLSMNNDLEQVLDSRIKHWARGKDITSMLHSIADVTLLNKKMFAMKGIYEMVSNMSNEPSDIRKIYLKVIRHCHPDKHSHLDSIGEEFLELKKVFTVLSDAYSRYKNDLAAYN